jgi:hypothetical protein
MCICTFIRTSAFAKYNHVGSFAEPAPIGVNAPHCTPPPSASRPSHRSVIGRGEGGGGGEGGGVGTIRGYGSADRHATTTKKGQWVRGEKSIYIYMYILI